MDIFGIGPLELIFILLITLIVLGPREMVNAGASLGKTLRKVMRSPTWKAVQETSRQIRHLPNTLVRQAGIEELDRDIRQGAGLADHWNAGDPQIGKVGLGAWTTPSARESTGEPTGIAPPPRESQEPTAPPEGQN